MWEFQERPLEISTPKYFALLTTSRTWPFWQIFEIVDGRTTDGRTPDHGHPISSPCEHNGSGELKKYSAADRSSYSMRFYTFCVLQEAQRICLSKQFVCWLKSRSTCPFGAAKLEKPA